ncbi:hypothetical protein HDU92_005342 [Lobulomyces angularis]|nr:hypothetical protein HDU92_005342 [Lobulomyces angularis]
MPTLTNTKILFVKRPTGQLIPNETFRITKEEFDTNIPDGHLLIRSVYLSLDPAMRGWMNDARSYIEPVKINDVMRGAVVGEVILSKNSKFKKGDYVQGTLGWQKYAISNGKDVSIFSFPEGTTLLQSQGCLGMTGMTAYFGLLDIGKPKAGETVVISGCAGATGSIAAQIAKAVGCRVVGIAGSEEKCEWLKEIGCDEALNYKDKDFAKNLSKATPKFIDVYFDNVGGDILNLCLRRLAFKGRVVLCGAISQYNEKEPKGPSAYMTLISMRAKMEGFIVFDYAKRYSEARKQILEWLNSGKIQQKETIVEGLENAPNSLLHLFEGKNIGKLLVKVSEEHEEDIVSSKF